MPDCRDCADHGPICPNDKQPCDPRHAICPRCGGERYTLSACNFASIVVCSKCDGRGVVHKEAR
jgi:hypothetical protein